MKTCVLLKSRLKRGEWWLLWSWIHFLNMLLASRSPRKSWSGAICHESCLHFTTTFQSDLNLSVTLHRAPDSGMIGRRVDQQVHWTRLKDQRHTETHARQQWAHCLGLCLHMQSIPFPSIWICSKVLSFLHQCAMESACPPIVSSISAVCRIFRLSASLSLFPEREERHVSVQLFAVYLP